MSLHIPLPVLADPPITTSYLYVGNGSTGPSINPLVVSRDNGLAPFEDMPAISGDLDSATNSVFYANGRLFRWSDGNFGGQGTHVSTNRGTSWTLCTGLPNTGAVDCYEILYSSTRAEWLCFTSSGLYVSANGKDFTFRATAGRIVKSPAIKDGTIIGIGGAGAGTQNEYAISVDGGLNWSLQLLANHHTTNGIQCILAVAAGFMLFGRDSVTGNLRISKSATGAVWSNVAPPGGVTLPVYYGTTGNYTSGHTAIVLQNGRYYLNLTFGTGGWVTGSLFPHDATVALSTVPTICTRRMRLLTNADWGDQINMFFPQGAGVNRIFETDLTGSFVDTAYTNPPNAQPNAIAVIDPS